MYNQLWLVQSHRRIYFTKHVTGSDLPSSSSEQCDNRTLYALIFRLFQANGIGAQSSVEVDPLHRSE